MKKYFESIIFKKVQQINPHYEEQLVAIEGDLMLPNIGLSAENRQLLIENVDIIIHNAASVYFDEKISKLLRINVLGTQEMLKLAEECINLKAFIYVSTAYAHSYIQVIEERCYPPPCDMKMVHDIIRADEENPMGISQTALNDILGQWTNNYTFTKSIAEFLVEEFSKTASFPCGIYRPAIVTSTHEEPLKSWSDNLNGVNVGAVAFGLGILHTTYILGNPCIDIIPVDMTAVALLLIPWDLATFKKDVKPIIYNYGSSTLNTTKFRDLISYVKSSAVHQPSVKMVWKPFNIIAGSYNYFYTLHIVFHFLPSLVMDFLCLLQAKKPFALQIFFRMNKITNKLLCFANGDWKIQCKNIPKIWDCMSPCDHEQFKCDVRTIDWEDYARNYWLGLRTYVLGEPANTSEIALRKQRILNSMHFTGIALLILLFLYFVYRTISYVLSFL
ncbi:hypothetical protein KM043_010381 [Ampulex compressa]|nr:hypothetical protein KM043_010381 [Ampulex compressa]